MIQFPIWYPWCKRLAVKQCNERERKRSESGCTLTPVDAETFFVFDEKFFALHHPSCSHDLHFYCVWLCIKLHVPSSVELNSFSAGIPGDSSLIGNWSNINREGCCNMLPIFPLKYAIEKSDKKLWFSCRMNCIHEDERKQSSNINHCSIIPMSHNVINICSWWNSTVFKCRIISNPKLLAKE